MIYNANNRKNFVTFHKKYAIFLNKITKSNIPLQAAGHRICSSAEQQGI